MLAVGGTSYHTGTLQVIDMQLKQAGFQDCVRIKTLQNVKF